MSHCGHRRPMRDAGWSQMYAHDVERRGGGHSADRAVTPLSRRRATAAASWPTGADGRRRAQAAEGDNMTADDRGRPGGAVTGDGRLHGHVILERFTSRYDGLTALARQRVRCEEDESARQAREGVASSHNDRAKAVSGDPQHTRPPSLVLRHHGILEIDGVPSNSSLSVTLFVQSLDGILTLLRRTKNSTSASTSQTWTCRNNCCMHADLSQRDLTATPLRRILTTILCDLRSEVQFSELRKVRPRLFILRGTLSTTPLLRSRRGSAPGLPYGSLSR
jgi:hypothetical protein